MNFYRYHTGGKKYLDIWWPETVDGRKWTSNNADETSGKKTSQLRKG